MPTVEWFLAPDTSRDGYEEFPGWIADGQAHTVSGDLATIMAGPNYGQPNLSAWPLLRDYASAFASRPDNVAASTCVCWTILCGVVSR